MNTHLRTTSRLLLTLTMALPAVAQDAKLEFKTSWIESHNAFFSAVNRYIEQSDQFEPKPRPLQPQGGRDEIQLRHMGAQNLAKWLELWNADPDAPWPAWRGLRHAHVCRAMRRRCPPRPAERGRA